MERGVRTASPGTPALLMDQGWLTQPPMLFPRQYIALLCFSTLDLIGTWIILLLGGSEMNPIADAVIQYWDASGIVAFKYAIVLFVIIVCEVVGRRRRPTGRRLAMACVLIAAVPVTVAAMLLLGAARSDF